MKERRRASRALRGGEGVACCGRLPERRETGSCERSRGDGLLRGTMNHKQKQLVLFSNRRRARKEHLPPSGLKARTSSRVPHETRPEVRGRIQVVWRIRGG